MIAELMTQAWCLESDYLKIVADQILRGAVDKSLAASNPSPQNTPSSYGEPRLVIISVHGPLTQRGGLFSSLFGSANYREISTAIHRAAADPGVEAIVLHLDSPGGQASGVQELADEVYQLRKSKRIVAQIDSLAASAAFWIASAAHEIVSAPSGMGGSVGVYSLHMDISEALKKEGIKPTIVRAGENKIKANPFEPLPDSAKEKMQSNLAYIYANMAISIGRNRGISADKVHDTYGAGELFNVRDLLKRGMIDRVSTLSETVARLGYAMHPAPAAPASSTSRPRQSAASASTSFSSLEASLRALESAMSRATATPRDKGSQTSSLPSSYDRLIASVDELNRRAPRAN